MSEEIHDQVSAFLDDELSGEECAFLVRRLERDPDARNKLIRYSLIGSVVRRDLVQPDPDMLRRRVYEALSGTSAGASNGAPAPRPAAAARPRWRRAYGAPAAGVGIAAAVALGAVLAVRFVNDSDGGSPGVGRVQALAAGGAPSYVVPQDTQQPGSGVQAPIRLTNYLVHHGEYASLLSRTSVHSNVVGAGELPVAETADDSAADDGSDAAGRNAVR
ncbi:MAG TPA: sigma-E factor negative regulatory protein [Gammaproteobacteria bacterium]|nr:sigma-E factor negative regulatory protein [Gammaproteobacteria bacterium]